MTDTIYSSGYDDVTDIVDPVEDVVVGEESIGQVP
jgi:hypothetical protein